ncbi:hypothetical protein [Paenibacillus massiliensis]|nr:hypothetical protein [Paenibacillus massiliensis]
MVNVWTSSRFHAYLARSTTLPQLALEFAEQKTVLPTIGNTAYIQQQQL